MKKYIEKFWESEQKIDEKISMWYDKIITHYFFCMDAFYMVLWLLMFAGNILCSIYAFGGVKNAPKWLLIIAGILNVFMLLSVFWMASGQ